MKLFVASNGHKGKGGGVRSVMDAHEKLLRAKGVEYVDNEKAADLVIVHAMGAPASRTDVYHSHGFYPTAFEDWGVRYNSVNQSLVNYVMTARSVVSASEQAAEVMRRDMHRDPLVIRNGVDFQQIQQGGKPGGYILWPKLSISPTCDPAPLKWLADHTSYPFASIANVADNIKSFEALPQEDFLALLKNCSIYLGITRENNPIAEMESMACGLPVVGFNWGFHREWLTSGYGCELVEPGDLPGLSNAIAKVLGNWKVYHEQALDFAQKNFGWDEPIQQIYGLYQSLLESAPVLSVSVVIPLYNYAKWIGEAVQSAKDAQPAEIIVVDDASTDNPIIPEGVKLIRFDTNQGVAVARNVGISQAKGNLIICLDADDKLTPTAIRRLVPKFTNPRVGIAFAPISLIAENGVMSHRRWFEEQYSYSRQRTGNNNCPSCAMFRKRAWEQAGGYRTYEKPAEDAGLWLRIASQGWKVENIGGESMLHYRFHHKVSEFRAGSETQLSPLFDWWKSNRAWSYRSSGVGELVQMYDCPQVSFVLVYRVQDELDFIRTLDSIEGMTAIEWEICASGIPPPLIKSGWPFVRWNEDPTSPTQVYLEAGDVLNDVEWGKIIEKGEFPG